MVKRSNIKEQSGGIFGNTTVMQRDNRIQKKMYGIFRTSIGTACFKYLALFVP